MVNNLYSLQIEYNWINEAEKSNYVFLYWKYKITIVLKSLGPNETFPKDITCWSLMSNLTYTDLLLRIKPFLKYNLQYVTSFQLPQIPYLWIKSRNFEEF